MAFVLNAARFIDTDGRHPSSKAMHVVVCDNANDRVWTDSVLAPVVQLAATPNSPLSVSHVAVDDHVSVSQDMAVNQSVVVLASCHGAALQLVPLLYNASRQAVRANSALKQKRAPLVVHLALPSGSSARHAALNAILSSGACVVASASAEEASWFAPAALLLAREVGLPVVHLFDATLIRALEKSPSRSHDDAIAAAFASAFAQDDAAENHHNDDNDDDGKAKAADKDNADNNADDKDEGDVQNEPAEASWKVWQRLLKSIGADVDSVASLLENNNAGANERSLVVGVNTSIVKASFEASSAALLLIKFVSPLPSEAILAAVPRTTKVVCVADVGDNSGDRTRPAHDSPFSALHLALTSTLLESADIAVSAIRCVRARIRSRAVDLLTPAALGDAVASALRQLDSNSSSSSTTTDADESADEDDDDLVIDVDPATATSAALASKAKSTSAVRTTVSISTTQNADQVESAAFNMYESMIRQTFGRRATINAKAPAAHDGNATGSGNDSDSDEEAGNNEAAADSYHQSAEFLLGVMLSSLARRQQLATKLTQLVALMLSGTAAGTTDAAADAADVDLVSVGLLQHIRAWLLLLDDAANATPSRVETHAEGIRQELTELHGGALAGRSHGRIAGLLVYLRDHHDALSLPSLWIVGGNEWQTDAGLAALHHALQSGANVNVLVVETASPVVLSGKRGLLERPLASTGDTDATPSSSASAAVAVSPSAVASRKKDVGLYAMNFGGVYVGSVAKYASYSHVLQVLIEADQFAGPSVVMAYAPQVTASAAQLKGVPATVRMMQMTQEAVTAGDWPLYRWDPRRDAVNEENQTATGASVASPLAPAFQLDSSALRSQVKEFLDRQTQLTLLARKEPVLAQTSASKVRTTVAPAVVDVRRTHAGRILSSFGDLMSGLGGEPLLVLYASDGGNAADCATKLVKAGKAGGLNARALAMDDFAVDDLAGEPHVVFSISTAGQGEFPSNGRGLWKALQQDLNEADLPLADTKFAIFGLGDSHYWPRPEDAHYFCKPAVDLDARLRALGAVPMLVAEDGDGEANVSADDKAKSGDVADAAAVGAARPFAVVKGDDQHADGYATEFVRFQTLLWTALGVGDAALSAASAGDDEKLPPDDIIKGESNYLRGTIAEGLRDTTTGALPLRDTKLTKFHGIYQQDDRDLREDRRKAGLEKAYSFMIRVGLPGGVTTPEQWLAMDDMCDRYGNGTFKLTTRQAYQLHGVLKGDLKKTIALMNRHLMTTLAACGDVCRNVMGTCLPLRPKLHAKVQSFVDDISAHLKPQTSAYHEIWLEKKLVAGRAIQDVEPLYGKTYLPRKFKVAIAIPPMNDPDVYAHCLSYVAIVDPKNPDVLLGYTVLVGGGMGMTHNNPKTYPQLARPLCFVTPEQALKVGEAIMIAQRDNGDRVNRKHARLKYTLDDRGLPWLWDYVENYTGFKLDKPRDFQFDANADRYGWIKSADKESEAWHYGLFVENGRLVDYPKSDAVPRPLLLRTALREIARVHQGDFRLTSNQHLIIANVPNEEEKAKIDALLTTFDLKNERYSATRMHAMACVALPTCGLALAESERYLPRLMDKLDTVMDKAGLRQDAITVRMTGCPNGCARPYLGEIGFVGRAPGIYNLYLGAGFAGNRLNKLYRSGVDEEQIISTLTPLLERYAKERQRDSEHFGDFLIRTGVIKPTTDGRNFHDHTEQAFAE